MNNKIFISHADIILDKIYDSEFNLVKQDGGGCNWNDLYNLSLMGETCYAFGSCGNDEEGKIALDSLKRAGVNTDNVLIDDTIRTDVMNILLPASSSLDDNDVIHTWYSPITNKSTMHFSDNLPLDIPEDFKDKEVYIILDKFENINYEFLQKIDNKKVCLDVGAEEFMDLLNKVKEAAAGTKKSIEPSASVHFSIRLFAFGDLDGVIRAARLIAPLYNGANTLYKDESTGMFLLALAPSEHSTNEFNKICNMLSEYASPEKADASVLAFLEEHCAVIISADAVQKLSTL